MKQIFQWCAMGVVAAGLLLSPSRPVVAQSAGDPAVVISLAGLGEQLNDVKYVMDKAGQGAMFGMISAQANTFLNGFDRSKALGALLYFSEESPEPKWMALVPVKNMDDVLDTISQFAEVEENGDVTSITPQGSGETMYVRESGGYAVISDSEEMLESAPSNPGELLSSVSADFNLGAKVFVQRIPEGMREMALSAIEEGYQQQMDAIGDEALAELQSQNFEMQMKRMKSLINETEQLVMGFNIDETAKSVHFDMQMVGLDGSELSRQSDGYGSADPTRFGGFSDDAATMSMSFSGKIAEGDAAEAKQSLDAVLQMALSKMEEENLGDSEKELATHVVTDLIDVLKATMDEGSMDMGAMVLLDDKNANLVAAVQVADPGKVEKSVKDIVAAAEGKTDDRVQFNLDMGSHEGVKLHEIVVSVPDDKAQALLGSEEAKILLGIGNKAVYFAAGNDPMETLKKAISGGPGSSGKPPMQMNLRLASLMKKVADVEDEEIPRMIADKLAKSGRDQISFVMTAIKNGLEMKLEAQDGILELLGVAAQMGMGGPGGDF